MTAGAASATRPPTSRVEMVYSRLREQIIRGKYAPGAPLRAGAIAGELDVSVIPVREAIRMLEAEGLVFIERNRGARVQDMSANDLEDIYLTRLTLEIDALQRSLPHLGEADFRELDTCLKKMTSAYENERIEEALGWHRRFHDGLYWRCDSRRLKQLIDTLWSATERYLWTSPQLSRGDNFGPEHERILDAARTKNTEEAVQALRVHHELALQRIRVAIPPTPASPRQ